MFTDQAVQVGKLLTNERRVHYLESFRFLLCRSRSTKSDGANRSGMAAIDLSDSRPIRVCSMSDRGDLHRVRGVIYEVQDPIVAAAC